MDAQLEADDVAEAVGRVRAQICTEVPAVARLYLTPVE
jgi:hypothetical protein